MYQSKLASIQIILWNILKNYGVDPSQIFHRAKLNPELLKDPGARYPLSNIAHLWEEIDKVIEDPCYGLKAARFWHPTHFGTLGYAMLESQSVRESLQRMLRFHRVISDANFGKLVDDKKAKTLIFFLNWDAENFSAAREDAAIALLLSICRLNIQEEFSPVSVRLTHLRPHCAGKHYSFFRCPVTFNSPSSCLVLPYDITDRILPGVDKDLLACKDQIMTKYIASLDQGHIEIKVKKAITKKLPSGNITIQQVAKKLGMSTRSMQRSLCEKGTNFAQILKETRSELAKQYVKDKTLELTEIAFLLGFSELSTFSRSFKKIHGISPNQYRKEA